MLRWLFCSRYKSTLCGFFIRFVLKSLNFFFVKSRDLNVFLLTHRHNANGILLNSLTNTTIFNLLYPTWMNANYSDESKENPRNPQGISVVRAKGTHNHAECMSVNLWEHIQMFDCDFVQQIIRTCGKEPQCIECIVRTMSVSLTALVNFYVCCRPTVRYTGA